MVPRALVGLALASGVFTLAGCQQQQDHASAQGSPTPSTAPRTDSPSASPGGRSSDCEKVDAIMRKANTGTKDSLMLPITGEKVSTMQRLAAEIRTDAATLDAPDVKTPMLRYSADMDDVAVDLRKAQGSSTDLKELKLAVDADLNAANEAMKITFACANLKGVTTQGGGTTTTRGGTTTTQGGTTTTP